MKTTLVSLLTATLLGLACRASGHSFDVSDFTAVLFVTGLVAWTMVQYNHRPRPLEVARPIHLPLAQSARTGATESLPLAA